MSSRNVSLDRGPLWFGPRVLGGFAIAAMLVVAIGWLGITKTLGRDSLATTAQTRSQHAVALTELLSRTADLGGGVEIQVTLATPTFFKLTNRTAEGAKLSADRVLVFVTNENAHYTDLPHHVAPILRMDGATVAVATPTVLTDSVHHRTTAFAFQDVPATVLAGDHTLELLFSRAQGDRIAIPWQTPIAYPDDIAGPAGLSLGLLLALGAGLLAVISPCLLQLTAFYVPTLAGVNAAGGQTRPRLVATAAVFVLGFTIPYTVGGALMGGFGSAIAASGILTPTGPIAEGAGVVMILMAGLVAYRARTPLVCKMPLPSRITSDARLPWVQTFTSGFAIATGCLACFGGAILGVLLVYTGLLGSPLLGALAMFAFSLGLAIPFLAAAFGLSRIQPIAESLQRHSRLVGTLAALAMLFFGLTMATGNYHIVSGWLAQRLPLG